MWESIHVVIGAFAELSLNPAAFGISAELKRDLTLSTMTTHEPEMGAEICDTHASLTTLAASFRGRSRPPL